MFSRRQIALASVFAITASMGLWATAPAIQAAGVPIACANVVSSVSVTEGDTVDLGIAGGCSLVSTSAAGNLEPLSSTSFLAFASGSGSINALVVDAAGVQYLNRVNVAIAAKPAPTPTPTPTPEPTSADPTVSPTQDATGTPSPTPTQSSAATPSVSASPASSPAYDLSDLRPSVVASTKPAPDQRLTKSFIDVATDAGPGNLVIEASNGNPVQLVDIEGDVDAFDVVSAGIDYSVPSNWQRLGYGDLCWAYSGYTNMQAVILPIADPPFTTVTRNWTLASAILVTDAGYRTFVGPASGDVVDAGGDTISTVIICGKASTNTTPSARAALMKNTRVTICHKPGTPAQMTKSVPQRALGGHLGHGDYLGPCTPVPQIVLPTLPPQQQVTTTSTATPEPSHSAIVADDHVLHMCRATSDPLRPYVLDSIRLSQAPKPPQDSAPFPQPGWTSVIEAWQDYPGQNWNGWGQQLVQSNCAVAPPSPQPQPTPTPMPTVTPTPTGTATPTPTVTTSPSATVSPSITPTASPSPTQTTTQLTWPPRVPTKTDYPIKQKYVVTTPEPTPTPTPTATPTPTSTPKPTSSVSASPQPTVTVTPGYVVPPKPTVTETPTVSPTPTLSPTATVTPTPNPTFSIVPGYTRPPIPYPSPTSTPTVVAPTQGPQSVYTPVLLQPTNETSTTGNSEVVLTIANGPSTVKVTKSAQNLIAQATNASAVVDSTPELAETGQARSSQAAFERHQERLQTRWPRGPSVAKLSWSGRGPTSKVSELFVSSGTTSSNLERGPGWYRDTTRPGADGNIAVAGHRTGFGAPFGNLDRMRLGDEISLQTPDGGVSTYQVAETLLVRPEATWVLGPDVLRDGSNTLTLTTCDPPGVNTRRLVVIAREVDR